MSLEECFQQVEDPRKASGLRFPLPAVLSMMVMSYLSGNTGYRASAKFMEGNEEDFTQLYGLKHGTPGHTQLNTIHKRLDFDQINQAFFKWINSFVSIEPGEWVHGDGKSLKSTVENPYGSEQDFELMVRLFARKLGIVIQSERTRNKSGEGAALHQLLQQLEHKGVIITLDALHCQKKR